MTYRDGYETAQELNAELRERLLFALREWELSEFRRSIDRGDSYASAGAFAEGAVRDGMARFEAAGKGVAVGQ